MTHEADKAPDQKVWTKQLVQNLVMTNDKALAKAITGLYQRQTDAERSQGDTFVHNGQGFNSRDASFLSDIAVKLPRYNGNMTVRQKAAARKMILKYWRQLLEMIDEKGGMVSYDAKSRSSEKKKPRGDDLAAQPPCDPATSHTVNNWTV